jgi:hypothetical protein
MCGEAPGAAVAIIDHKSLTGYRWNCLEIRGAFGQMRKLAIAAALFAVVLAHTGCPEDAATQNDAAPQDDAALDPVNRSGAQLTPTSGRVSGGVYTLDVQIGHPFAQRPVTGGGTTVEGGAAIKF